MRANTLDTWVISVHKLTLRASLRLSHASREAAFVLILFAFSFLQPALSAQAKDSAEKPANIRGLLHIGSQRQLFLDESIVETMENTKRRLNPALKSISNPVLKVDKPWEGPDNRIDWIFYDHRLKRFRLRYKSRIFYASGRDEKESIIVRGERDSDPVLVCEAFSEDGIKWEKPQLGLVEFEGTKANNIVPDNMHCAFAFEDLHDLDPKRRYKGLKFSKNGGEWYGDTLTFSYYYSPDGYDWTAYGGNPVNRDWGWPILTGWDPIRKCYGVHFENEHHRRSDSGPFREKRVIGRAESPDMIHWSGAETIIVPDGSDYPDTEFYQLETSHYEGWSVGFLWNFSTTNTTIHPQFVFSRDGIHYSREHREPVIRRGDNGDFDSAAIYARQPIVHKGEIYCFYYGTNWRSPETLVELGEKAACGIGLAKLPLDGFVSLEGARRGYSIVTTRSFTFTGASLYLNMRAALQQWGAGPCEVKVELLDGRHVPIEGYTFEDADNLPTTNIKQQVTWNDESDITSLSGRPIRLRIFFKNAKLYAFQFI